MDKAILDIIEEIIELIESENVEAYAYDGQKFHIIDKYNNIDFQAKLSNNNYYFKDNISGLSFTKVKKYINDNTTVQQILIEEDKEKCYYSYLERDGYVCLVRAIRVDADEKDSLVCNNMNVLNQSWKDIVEYADEHFDNITNLDEIEAREFNPNESDAEEIADEEDEEIRRKFGITDEFEDAEIDDDECSDGVEYDSEEDDYDYEMNQIEENEKYGLSDVFENNTIQDYQMYIVKKEEYENDSRKYDQSEDHLPISEYTEAVEEYYSNYQLHINGKTIDGEAKARIIADCEAAVDEKAYDSNMFDHAVTNLKAVLEAVQKTDDVNKKDEYEI